MRQNFLKKDIELIAKWMTDVNFAYRSPDNPTGNLLHIKCSEVKQMKLVNIFAEWLTSNYGQQTLIELLWARECTLPKFWHKSDDNEVMSCNLTNNGFSDNGDRFSFTSSFVGDHAQALVDATVGYLRLKNESKKRKTRKKNDAPGNMPWM